MALALTLDEKAEAVVRELAEHVEEIWDEYTTAAEIITAAIRAAVAEEREACARVVDAESAHHEKEAREVRGMVAAHRYAKAGVARDVANLIRTRTDAKESQP